MRAPLLDETLRLFVKGYSWLPDRRRASGATTVRTRLLGMPAVGVKGPEAARFFYDEDHVRRSGALPEPVRATIFGKGAVHTLDGEVHRLRKAMFVGLLMGDGVSSLVDRVSAAWDAAVPGWAARPDIALLEESAQVLTAAVCGWAGIPLADGEVGALSGDLLALIDGFGSAGPRHWRARRARSRREAWLGRLVEDVRSGSVDVPEGSAVAVVAAHRDGDGELLTPRVAAVELLNII